MTVTLWLALLLIAASPAILRLRYGRDWLMRPFSLFILAGCVYHGLSEVVIRLTGAQDLAPWRPPIAYADEGALIAGAAMLALTIGYLMLAPRLELGFRPDLEALKRAFDWRVLTVALLPLLVATVTGHGYSSGQALQGGGATQQGFAFQFFVPVVVLTAFAVLLRAPRWFLLIVVVQSVLMALAGQRLEIIIAGITLWLLARRVGLGPSRRKVLVGVALAGVLVYAIGSSRAAMGREVFHSDSGLGARLQAVKEGLLHPHQDSVNGGGTLAEAGLRLDSNAWTGNVAFAFTRGAQPMGRSAITDAVLSELPSVLYPQKLNALTLDQRSPETAAIDRFGIPNIDYLPGDATYFYPALGLGGLLVFSLAVGVLLGLLDTAALRRPTVARIVLLATLAEAALFFERGLPFYLEAGRGAVVILLGVVVWGRIRQAFVIRSRRSDRRAGGVYPAGAVPEDRLTEGAVPEMRAGVSRA